MQMRVAHTEENTMKKLAINSFLAVTAMAWSAQSPASPTLSQQLRDTARSNAPGMYRSSTQGTRGSVGTLALKALPAAPFSPSERGLIRSWLRGLTVPVSADAPALVRGQQLEFIHLCDGRALPGWLNQSIQSRVDGVVDVLLGSQVVRLTRPDNLVIDLV